MEDTADGSFGRLLRRLRRDAELTQEELAERAGLSPRGIGDLERGARTTPYRATVEQLADALELGPADRAALLRAARRRSQAEPALPPSLIPAPLTPLIGRESEVADIQAFLERPEGRLITLTGPGGVGKTRLALEVATGYQQRFFEETHIVPLASVEDPSLVAPTVVHALGLRDTSGVPPNEILARYLREKKVLLVLDNFEHLLETAPTVAELLAICPQLTVLATSRAALRVQGEQEYPVEPLPVPDPTYAPPLQSLLRYPAVELFLQRARAVRPAFRLGEENAVTVTAICRRLDGLPLAIELAAARIKIVPPQALLPQLSTERGFGTMRMLAHETRDQPPRLRTMRNAISWTYDYLPANRQALFRRLAVLVAGGTLDAIEAICQPDGDQPEDVFEGVADLVEHSLLRPEEQEDGEARFAMLETIREFALERLEERGESEPVRDRHAGYFLALAEEIDVGSNRGPDQTARLARLEHEHGNLRAALSWMMRQGAEEAALRLAAALGYFWLVRGYLS